MNKLLFVLLSLGLTFSITACGKKGDLQPPSNFTSPAK